MPWWLRRPMQGHKVIQQHVVRAMMRHPDAPPICVPHLLDNAKQNLYERPRRGAFLFQRPWPDAPEAVDMHHVDIRKRGAEEVFRSFRPEAVIHMGTVTHLVQRSEDRFRINLQGTRAVLNHSERYGAKQVAGRINKA